MKKILVFAGTTEGREVSEILSKNKIKHTVCVATKYGELMIEPNEYAEVHCERMDEEKIQSFIEASSFEIVVDATHPYAFEVTKNIKDAVDAINKSERKVRYIRLKRDMGKNTDNEKIIYFKSNEECVKELMHTPGNILLTTGSKELSLYAIDSLKERLFARVIPSEESIKICNSSGITGKNIIAMQGPFTLEMNEALIDMYDISVMVTKQSGIAGGFFEKAEAAKNKDIPLFVIGLEGKDEGLALVDAVNELSKGLAEELDISIEEDNKKAAENSNRTGAKTSLISIIGVGMGSEGLLTIEAKEAINEADVLFGAKRLLDVASNERAERYPYYLSKDIIPKFKEIMESKGTIKAAVLFSGDSSFYSGATALNKALNEEKIKSKINIIPGISSVAYLAAKVGTSYSDALILSTHGREIKNIAKRISSFEKTFILVSGAKDVNAIASKLEAEGFKDIKITLGNNLSYQNESIKTLTLSDAKAYNEEGVITLFVRNPEWKKKRSTHGLGDEEFIRNTTPMTKEEVREVSLCKLRLNDDSVIYDVGSGTGSIAIECALLSDDIEVYAIEKKDEASDLIERNIEKFRLENITLIRGCAPEALDGLKAPTHAFIGGSSGNMNEILEKLKSINPSMRVVINAITIETLLEMKKIPEQFKVKDFEIIQMQVSRANTVGDYNLMKAENGVWICSFDFNQ